MQIKSCNDDNMNTKQTIMVQLNFALVTKQSDTIIDFLKPNIAMKNGQLHSLYSTESTFYSLIL